MAAASPMKLLTPLRQVSDLPRTASPCKRSPTKSRRCARAALAVFPADGPQTDSSVHIAEAQREAQVAFANAQKQSREAVTTFGKQATELFRLMVTQAADLASDFEPIALLSEAGEKSTELLTAAGEKIHEASFNIQQQVVRLETMFQLSDKLQLILAAVRNFLLDMDEAFRVRQTWQLFCKDVQCHWPRLERRIRRHLQSTEAGQFLMVSRKRYFLSVASCTSCPILHA